MRSRFITYLILALVIVLPLLSVSAQDAGTTINWSIEGISDVVSLDPARASDAQGFTVVELLFAGLVRLNDELLVVPDLAEGWEVSEDGLTYTFTLREDSAFSDGSTITANDVVWSLNHALNPATGGWTGPYLLGNIQGAAEVQAGEADTLSGVTAIDDRIVSISINQPSAYFLSQLTFGPAKVVSAAAAEADEAWDQNPVTSGAFSVSERNPGQGLVLVPNSYYWQPAEQVVALNILFNQDSETAYQLFRTGALDIMGGAQNPLPAARVPEVADSPDFVSTNALNDRYVAFNNTQPPFDNVDVRRAFAMAVDKVTLADVVLGGTVVAADGILPPGMPAADLPIESIPFDPEGARALLTEAGVDPASLNLTLTYGVEGDNERVVTVLQSMWAENLGVNVTLEPLELSTFSSRLNDTYNDPENGLQAYYSVWGTIYPDPSYFLSETLGTGKGNNNSHYSNAEFDALNAEADVITDDDARRFELYNQAEQTAVSEVGWLPLFHSKVNVLVRECVEGVSVTGLFSAYVIPNYSELRGCPAE